MGRGRKLVGFTGEQTDPSGLVYLRARYYDPASGRFLSRDRWPGSAQSPQSLNRWSYALNNPIVNTDPSGYITKSQDKAASIVLQHLKVVYDIQIVKDWGSLTYYDPLQGRQCDGWRNGNWRDLHELELVRDAIDIISNKLGGGSKVKAAVGGTKVYRWSKTTPFLSNSNLFGILLGHTSWVSPMTGDMILADTHTFDTKNDTWIQYVVIHEFGHVWDLKYGGKLSLGLSQTVGTETCYQTNLGCGFDDSAGIEPPPGLPDEEYARTNRYEDFADTFASYIYGANYLSFGFRPIGPIRTQYVIDLVTKLP